VRHSTVAGVCRQQQLFLSLVVMQGIEQARDHPCGVAESGVGRDILDAFAVDEDLAAVAQGFDILRTGLRPGNFHLADIFGSPCEGYAVAAAVGFRHCRLGRCCAGRVSSGRLGPFCHCYPPVEFFDRWLSPPRFVRYANSCAESELEC